MSTIINGSSPSITFSDSTTQASAGLTSSSTLNASNVTTGTLPSAQLPTGSVLQVVNTTYNTTTTTDSGTYIDTGLTLNITPTKSTSKILVIVTGFFVGGTSSTWCYGQLVRGSTPLCLGTGGLDANCTFAAFANGGISSGNTISYLDSPATTSATTYKLQFKSGDGTGYPVGFNRRVNDLYYAGCSAITLMEIAG